MLYVPLYCITIIYAKKTRVIEPNSRNFLFKTQIEILRLRKETFPLKVVEYGHIHNCFKN